MGKKTRGIDKDYQIRLSENALNNINEITDFVAFINYQPINAIKLGDDLFILLERIQKHPYAFKECDVLTTKSKMYRQAIFHKWLVIYKIVSIQITILGIIHTSRHPSYRKILRKIK